MSKIKVTLKKSLIGGTEAMRRNVASLGLKKLNSTAIHNDTPAIRGMIHVVRHLVSVEEIND
ncbi:MAG: 50S ribosomal protein L30 [Clostridiales bacterium]|nr:50S ribosomal protein L30 [Clostridiales bacterium]